MEFNIQSRDLDGVGARQCLEFNSDIPPIGLWARNKRGNTTEEQCLYVRQAQWGWQITVLDCRGDKVLQFSIDGQEIHLMTDRILGKEKPPPTFAVWYYRWCDMCRALFSGADSVTGLTPRCHTRKLGGHRVKDGVLCPSCHNTGPRAVYTDLSTRPGVEE